jgi:hypothetical protein
MAFRSQLSYWLGHQVITDDTKIWFGKHKDTKMIDLPETYANWLKSNTFYENIKNYYKYKE